MDNPNRTLTIRLMVATAFLMLTALVGALASLGGDDTAAAWGKALLSAPIFGALFVFLYVVWKADLPHLWRELAETLASWQSPEALDRLSDRSLEQRPTRATQHRPGTAQSETPEEASVVRSAAQALQRSNALRYWVHYGPHRHQQLTPDEMAADLERLLPLAGQAEEAKRAAERAQEALHRLETQYAEAETTWRATLSQQAEALAAEWTTDLVTRWYEVLFPAAEVPDPDAAFAQIREETERLRAVERQAATQATRLAEFAQTLQRRTDELATREQQLNTLRQRLDAVREVLGLSAEMPLIEGARQRQAERQAHITGAEALRQARDEWQHKAKTLEETIHLMQAEAMRLRALAEEAASWEEVSEEALTAFWPTVKLDGEAFLRSQRRQRRLLQRLRAAGILLVRHRTAVLEAGGEVPPPLPHKAPSPTANLREETGADGEESTVEEGGMSSTVSSTVEPVRRVRYPVRSVRSGTVRRRRPSMGHY